MELQAVATGISFADAELTCYEKSDASLKVYVSTWDESPVDLLFEDVIRVLDNDASGIAGLYVVSGSSEFLESALGRLYETEAPRGHPYKHYRLLDVDGIPTLEVVSSSVSVTRRR